MKADKNNSKSETTNFLKEWVEKWEKKGFVKDRQSGSHAIFTHPDGRWTSVPIHRKTIGKGLLRKILRDIRITTKELTKR